MANLAAELSRVFKTRWFSKAAKKVAIGDEELCSAIQQVVLGQAVNLGGGVFKKRIGRNLYRSIVVRHAGRFWVFEYLFAKKIATTSMTMNLRRSEGWRRHMEA